MRERPTPRRAMKPVRNGNVARRSEMIRISPDPGPLGNGDVIYIFRSATYAERVLTEDTIMYRVSGGSAGEIGSYWSTTPQNGHLQSQLDLALVPEWGNTVENVTSIVVPKGTTVFEGTAAPQYIYDSMGNIIGELLGRGNQIYIPKVGEAWLR